MNEYFIEQKIKTLSDLAVGLNNEPNSKPEMIIDGYQFLHWEFNISQGWIGDAWIVKKVIEANNCVEAAGIFRGDLDKIVQKVGFVSQCYMDFYKEPFLIYKKNENKDNIFFYKHIQEVNGVGLHFDNEELNNFHKLSNFRFPEAFRFLQESRNTIGYIPKLMLLFSALEAMCDKKEIEKEDGSRYVTYDRDEMKKILGCILFNKIFGPDGIRHKLNHGEMVDSAFGLNYVEEIYKHIICYFNDVCKLNIDTKVVSPQRHFYDNQEYLNCWLSPIDDKFEIDLKNCIENYSNKNNSMNGCDYIPNFNPDNY